MLSDLNWGRLTAWRNLIASFWDVPDYRAHLDALDSIVIEYKPSASVPEEIACQALLTAGWLASRLGWQPTDEKLTRDGDCFRITLNAGARAINLEFRASGEGADGALRRIVFRGANGAAEFYAMLDESGTRLETSAKIGDAISVGRVLGYEAKSEGRRLSREMSILARDEIYEQAVAVAAKLIASLGAVA
jgi:glucose-6-phosphate dehydrogenase assembly protein OpcA